MEVPTGPDDHPRDDATDDRLQRESMGRVIPDSFTHGTSEQRMRWFKKGYDTGDLRQGNTFEANPL